MNLNELPLWIQTCHENTHVFGVEEFFAVFGPFLFDNKICWNLSRINKENLYVFFI